MRRSVICVGFLGIVLGCAGSESSGQESSSSSSSSGGGGGSSSSGGQRGPRQDPYPQYSIAGTYEDGSGCIAVHPAETAASTATDVSITLSGTYEGPLESADWFVTSSTGAVHDGPVDAAAGRYTADVPLFCGPNTIKLVLSSPTCDTVLVEELQPSRCSGGCCW